MRKHNLLLSLLALLFAVFMTACENGTTNDAKQSVDNGGDQGGVVTPTLSFSYEYVDTKTVKFTGLVENANAEDYEFTWDFGDGVVSPKSPLVIEHTYIVDQGYGVTLTASPKDPENTPALPNATGIVTISESGIVIQAFRYSALSGMEYEFQAIATTTDNSPVLYTWDFGDGTVVTDTPQNAMTHRYTKYNTEYTVKVSVKKENAGNTNPLAFPDVKIKTPGVTAQLTIEDDINNKTFKRMSVNIYDVTGALIHGYSDATGEVNTLDNVTYKWDFGDSKEGLTTNERLVEYTYETASGTYDVSVTITSDSFTDSIPAEGTANVEVTYALTGLRAELGGRYGTELTVVAEGNGGQTYANKNTIYYEVTYPNGNKAGQQVSHNESGVGTHTFTRDLDKYFNSYNIKVEAKANSSAGEVLATKTVTVEKPSFRYVLNGPNNGNNGYFSKSFNIAVAQDSFELKGAYFDWVTDGTTKRTSVPNFSHTYAGPGSKTVTVTIDSDMLNNVDITVPKLTKTFTINADVTINSLNCVNNGAGQDFLQYTCTVSAAGPTGTTLNYKWYLDGKLVSGVTGTTYTKKFDVYNKNYTVKVEVAVNGSNAAAKSTTKTITTPGVQVTLAGPTTGVEKVEYNYTATTKVRVGNAEKNITLANASYKFKIAENNQSETINKKVWTRSFDPQSDFGSGNTVDRTISVEVTGSNFNGTATSNNVRTTIRREEATLNSFKAPVIACAPVSDINQVRQKCTMTLTVKDGVTATGDFNQYTGKIIYNNTSYTAKFPAGKLSAGASKSISTVIDYNWPNSGEVTTGSPANQTYTVTGNFYKNGTPNQNTPSNTVNIDINLNMDYVLFPLVESYWYRTSGGSGYSFGTWSCGHNETTSSQVTTPLCGSSNSTSGQTLNLGHLVDAEGRLKQTLNFEWHMKINSVGTSLQDTVIKSFTVQKGQKPDDSVLRFNIASILNKNSVRYTGSVYGQTNMFYLKISSGNADILAKPIKIWYNGASKTDKANRLRKITPMIQNPEFSRCTMSYIQGGNGYEQRTVTFHLTEARVSFDRADKTNNIYDLIPTGDYKPFFRFVSAAKDSLNWSANATNNTNNTRIERNSTHQNEWIIRDNSYGVPSRITLPNKVNIGAGGLNDGRSTMRIVFKDMMQGAGGAEIIYHPTFTCDKSVGAIK